MKNIKPYLKKSHNGASVTIVFADGTESEPYSSQLSFVDGVPELVKTGKLTQQEADTICVDLMQEKNLPVGGEEDLGFFEALFSGNTPGSDQHFGFNLVVVQFTNRPTPLEVFKSLFPEITPDTEINEPLFRVCECGTHALILYKYDSADEAFILSSDIYSRRQARNCVEAYEKENTDFTPRQKKKLIDEINNSSLTEILYF